MKILELIDQALSMLEDTSRATAMFARLMKLSHEITHPEHPINGEAKTEFYKVKEELLKESKYAIARAYQVNTKIPSTQDKNIVAHYYDDALQYIEKLGFNIDLPRRKDNATEDMGAKEGRCWEGDQPVEGVAPYAKGSCEKK